MMYAKYAAEWIFVIDADMYIGYFDRNMCAFMTGQYGQCEVGKEEAASASIDPNLLDWFNNHVEQCPDDNGCLRPCIRWIGLVDQSTAISFTTQPPLNVIAALKERAELFCTEPNGVIR
jgi:hypothetical protein